MRHHRRRENLFACLRSITSNCCAQLFNIPRSHSLVFVLQLFALLRRIAEPIPFLPPSFTPPEISLFWETLIAITPSGTQKVVPTPVRNKYSIGSSLLISFLSITLTYLLFPVASLAVATPLISSLLLSLSPSVALGRCFRTWVLITYQFYQLSFSRCYSAPTNVTLPSIFRKLAGMTFYFDSHCPSAKEYSSLSLTSAAALFASLILNAAKSSISFGPIKRHPKAWWSVEVEGAVSERCKTRSSDSIGTLV